MEKVMIRIATVFSGIGAVEQAFKQLKIEQKIEKLKLKSLLRC